MYLHRAAHCAAAKGNIEVLAMISKHNGPLWLKTERGECPAHEAALARETGNNNCTSMLCNRLLKGYT